MTVMFKYKNASCGFPAWFPTGSPTDKGGFSSGDPQTRRRKVEPSYNAVISGGTCDSVRENEVTRAPAQTDPGSWPNPRKGFDMPDDIRSHSEHEASLRLAAIETWARQAQAGDCPIHVALTAISELVPAAQRFLARPEAA